MEKLALWMALAMVACTPAAADAPKHDASRIEITVTKKGFEPDNIKVPAGKPITLVFTRKTEQTCAKEVVVTLAPDKTIERKLPLDQPVEIVATFPKAGTLGYACGMNMTKGVIVVQ